MSPDCPVAATSWVMPTDDFLLDDLLARYLAGECTSEERADVERYALTVPDAASILDSARLGWDASAISDRMSAGRVALFLSELHRTIGDVRHIAGDLDDVVQKHARRPGTVRRRDGRLGEYVASPSRMIRSLSRGVRYSITGLVIGSVGLIVGWQARSWRGPSHGRAASASTITYATGKGQRATVVLPDGSTVALDVASRLDVPADYVAGNHTLYVRYGEAMFTTRHSARTPFSVVSGATTVRVLGTSFLVRHYETDTSTMIAVRDGKVAVRSTVVTAQQQAVVTRAGAIHVESTDPTQFSFTTGVLVLHDVLLRDAAATLGRWYDADIRFGNSAVANRRIAGEFASGSLADLAAILELTFDIKVVRDGRVLTLYQR